MTQADTPAPLRGRAASEPELQHLVAIPHGQLPSLHNDSGAFLRLLTLPGLALRHSFWGVSMTVLSALVSWLLGYARKPVIDQLIFKSIFIIFGFTMGFRNVRANSRYYEAMEKASHFYSGFWGVYAPLPVGARQRVRDDLMRAMKDCAAHIHRVAVNTRCCWYGIVGLEPAEELHMDAQVAPAPGYGSTGQGQVQGAAMPHSWVASPSGSRGAWRRPPEAPELAEEAPAVLRGVLAPRIRLLMALIDVEQEIEVIEPGREQKLKRGFWQHKNQLLASYDSLLSLAFPSVTDRFMTFVDLCLLVFAVALPWGIHATDIQVRVWGAWWLTVNSGFVLVVNTTLVVMVLFTLNALTCENENPLSGDSDDVDLNRLTQVLAAAVDAYEREQATKVAVPGVAEVHKPLEER